MSVFGTREDDPLLQNDPLAPSPDDEQEGEPSSDEPPYDEESSEKAVSEDASSEAAPSDKETAPTDGPETDASTSHSEGTDSVFGPGSSSETEDENHFRLGGSEDTRAIVRSAKEAASGRLTVLNAAFDQGWRLSRVDVQEDPTPEAASDPDPPSDEDLPSSQDGSSEASSPEDPSLTLAFVLRQPE